MWAANRYYYQDTIPRKDAAIISNCPDSTIRAQWSERIRTHDVDGGLSEWLMLTQGLGLKDAEVQQGHYLLPIVKFSCDAYFHFCRDTTWQEAMCSSMTHLFAGDIHNTRIKNWPDRYPWIPESAFTYFKNRTTTLPSEIQFTTDTLESYFTASQERLDRALEIVRFKQDVLWSLLDALWHHNYASICHVPIQAEPLSVPQNNVIHILGSGAGGGVPQWNRNDDWNSFSRGYVDLQRSQCSFAISGNRKDWILVNVSPDFRMQWNKLLRQYPNSVIRSIIITDAQLDHVLGLLSLRESKIPLTLYTTDSIYNTLSTHSQFLPILECYTTVTHHAIVDSQSFMIENIRITPHILSSRAPKYSTAKSDVLALIVGDILIAPCVSEITERVRHLMRQCRHSLFDGTFATASEMPSVSGHVSMEVTNETVSRHDLPSPHFVHINSTNQTNQMLDVQDGTEFAF